MNKQHPALKWANSVNEIVAVYKDGSKPRTLADSTQIKSSEHASKVLRDMSRSAGHLLNDIEYFTCLYLNRNGQTIGWQVISQGGMTGTIADIRIILRCALIVGAVSMIVSHNHPSGNLQPSESDIDLTERIKEASSLMDIKLHDHIIITSEGFYSFVENGNF